MPKDECAFGIRHDSYPPNAIRAFGVDLDRCQQACGVDLGEYQKVFIPGERLQAFIPLIS